MCVVSTSPNGVKRGGILGQLLAPLRHADCIERCPEVVRFRHFSDVRCVPRVAIFSSTTARPARSPWGCAGSWSTSSTVARPTRTTGSERSCDRRRNYSAASATGARFFHLSTGLRAARVRRHQLRPTINALMAVSPLSKDSFQPLRLHVLKDKF